MLDLIKEGLTVVFSAFAGAWLAFLSERLTARLEKNKTDYSALREAHFAILQQHMQLISLRDQYLAIESRSPAAWLTMRPAIGLFDAPRLEVSKLLFILEGPEPDLLNRLLVAQQKFNSLQSSLEHRNGAHYRLQEKALCLASRGSFQFLCYRGD